MFVFRLLQKISQPIEKGAMRHQDSKKPIRNSVTLGFGNKIDRPPGYAFANFMLSEPNRYAF